MHRSFSTGETSSEVMTTVEEVNPQNKKYDDKPS